MCILNDLIENICETLTGFRSSQHNIIRIHTRKLQELGDLSFPLDTKSWFQFVDKRHIVNKNTIFECKSTKEELIAKSKDWSLSIDSVLIKNDNVIVFLVRKQTFQNVINKVMIEQGSFGSENTNSVVCAPQNSVDFSKIHLTGLKIHLIQNFSINIINFLNCKTEEVLCGNCGCVLNENGCKDLKTTAEELYRQRTIDMRLMAEHKYGVRITSSTGWKEFFEKLGVASVTLHLLQNKPQHTTIVKLNDPTSSAIKGFFFVNTKLKKK